MDTTNTDRILQGMMSILINPNYFGLSRVYIKSEEQGYRLVVQGPTKILFQKIYATARGARIAFSKQFGTRSFKKRIQSIKPEKRNVQSEWSHFYETEWK